MPQGPASRIFASANSGMTAAPAAKKAQTGTENVLLALRGRAVVIYKSLHQRRDSCCGRPGGRRRSARGSIAQKNKRNEDLPCTTGSSGMVRAGG
jgi:hypothetical protein